MNQPGEVGTILMTKPLADFSASRSRRNDPMLSDQGKFDIEELTKLVGDLTKSHLNPSRFDHSSSPLLFPFSLPYPCPLCYQSSNDWLL
uniref:Uncharacterized protein n=1 Tax=Plectus sambesii TaxID=2011161 RepID=A0A914WZM8_9BILA